MVLERNLDSHLWWSHLSHMGGDERTRINHPVYDVKEGDPDFMEKWKSLPDTTEAEKLVRKLCLADQRKLMVEEGAD